MRTLFNSPESRIKTPNTLRDRRGTPFPLLPPYTHYITISIELVKQSSYKINQSLSSGHPDIFRVNSLIVNELTLNCYGMVGQKRDSVALRFGCSGRSKVLIMRKKRHNESGTEVGQDVILRFLRFLSENEILSQGHVMFLHGHELILHEYELILHEYELLLHGHERLPQGHAGFLHEHILYIGDCLTSSFFKKERAKK